MNAEETRLEYVDLAFHARALRSGRLPGYLGSTLRGAVAGMWKARQCRVEHRDCPRCALRYRCLYPLFFEPPPYPEAPLLAQQGNPPPLILYPPLPASWSPLLPRSVRVGDGLAFRIRLFGPAVRWWKPFRSAVEAALMRGLGRYRVTFRCATEPADSSFSGESTTEPKIQRIRPPSWPATGELNPLGLRIRFLTPLRMVQRGRLEFTGEPAPLLANILRRYSRLCLLYGSYGAVDYRTPVEAARGIRVSRADLEWIDWIRTSRRQGARMKLGGVVGTVVYREVPPGCYAWLKIGEAIHAGKNTVFGLGRFAVELDPPGSKNG